MTEQQRNVPIAAEISLLRKGSSDRGNFKSWYAPVGRFNADDATFRALQRWAFEWSADIYRLKAAYLDLYGVASTAGPASVAAFGGSPTVSVRNVSSDFVAFGGEANGTDYSDWKETAATVYGGPSLTGPSAVSSGTIGTPTGRVRLNVIALVEAIAPARVLKRDGTPCDGGANHGWRIFSDESDQTNRWTYKAFVEGQTHNPVLTLVFDDNSPPGVPVITSPAPSTSGTTVDSVDAKQLTVQFTVTLASGDTAQRVQVEVYADGATADEDAETQPVTGTRIATSTVAPTSTGAVNRYRTSLTGLRPREYQLLRIRVQNQKGAWGRWTELAQGRIFSAYTPGVPLDPRMTSDPTGPVISATLNSQDPLDGVTGLTGTFVRHNADGSTTNLWPDLSKIEIEYVPGVKRAEVTWRGISLNDGDRVSWRVALFNRDGVESPLTGEFTTVMHTVVGPTFDPADATTKLTSRTTGVTILDPIEFDAYRYRLYRNDILFYTSPIISSGPDTTADITFPTGLLNWGDTFGIEGETRPTNTTVFGPTSTRAVLYIDTLPTTSLTVLDEDGRTGDVIGTDDPIFHAPYSDPDAARFGETPVAKLLELRHAATPQGSGDLIDQRLSIEELKPIDEDEESGYQILPLTAATGWVPDADVSTGTTASAPTDYTGNSLRLTFAASASGRGATYTFPEPLDWSRFGSHTYLALWRKLSSEGNLTKFVVGITSADGWAEWTIYDPPSDNTATWVRSYGFLGFADDGTEPDVDWTSVESIWVWAYVSGSYSGTVDLRDLTIGFEVLDSDPPDDTYGIAFEESYDARIRYRDDADAIVTTQLAASASASATNIKVDSVVGLAAGQEITVGDDTERNQETRTIATVGTSGAGGTGIDLVDALFYAHADNSTVRLLPWGPNTAWRRFGVSEPPTVVATSPTDGATVTDPTPAYTFTFTSPAGKDMALHVLRVYARTDGVDRLIYERDVEDAATTVTGPYFGLEDGLEYAWEVDGYDTDGLVGTTDRFSFTTDFTVPDAITDLTATTDTARGWITLTWTPSDDPELAFHIVRFRDADGQLRRVDLGPRTIDDGREPLLDGTFTFRRGRLGTNVFQVSVHNGAQESEPAEVEVTLEPARPGAWMLRVDDDRGLAWPFDPTSAPRTPQATVETFRPPGRPYPVHQHWGTSGRRTSLRMRYLPSEAALARQMTTLLATGDPVSVAAAPGYDWDEMRARVVAAGPEDPQQYGWVDLSLDLDEIAPEVPG